MRIDEVKQYEMSLRDSEERIRAAMETVADGIITIDAKCVIQSFNPAAARIFGYEAGEVIGRNVKLLMPEPYYHEHDGYVANYLKTGDKKVIGIGREVAGLRKDGVIIPLELAVSEMKIKGERMFTGILRDITERKRMEKLTTKRSTELAAANHELEAFCYSVAHDLRAPLRSMEGFSQILLKSYKDVLDEKGKDYLQRVCAASTRMGDLIDDLLSLSRLGRSKLERRSVDLSQMVRSIAAELKKAEPERQVAFEITPGLIARADLQMLHILLDNLLRNAWKFTSKKSQAMIEFGATDCEGKRVYYVRDNGAGFDMAYADKLFQPFQRLHMNHEFPGTGIGLAIVARIIHRHDGDIWAESAVEQGATIYFMLEKRSRQDE